MVGLLRIATMLGVMGAGMPTSDGFTLRLPAGPVDHFTSAKPMGKRASRRLRGKQKAALRQAQGERGF